MTSYDVVVLAGGASRRMQVPDKTRIDVGGATLLDRVLAATSRAANVVVVGDARPTTRAVVWTREEPPGGGPAAAVAAALPLVAADTVVLLAGDMPFTTTDDVEMLVASVRAAGAVFVDGDGREQWLCGAWRTHALRALPLDAGVSLGRALAALDVARVAAPARERMAWFDCDTPDDRRRAEDLLT